MSGVCVARGGLPQGPNGHDQAKKAESLQDYDDAYGYYQKAVKADPNNANFKFKVNQSRFDARSNDTCSVGMRLENNKTCRPRWQSFSARCSSILPVR